MEIYLLHSVVLQFTGSPAITPSRLLILIIVLMFFSDSPVDQCPTTLETLSDQHFFFSDKQVDSL